jgi:hypothetical protein
MYLKSGGAGCAKERFANRSKTFNPILYVHLYFMLFQNLLKVVSIPQRIILKNPKPFADHGT